MWVGGFSALVRYLGELDSEWDLDGLLTSQQRADATAYVILLGHWPYSPDNFPSHSFKLSLTGVIQLHIPHPPSPRPPSPAPPLLHSQELRIYAPCHINATSLPTALLHPATPSRPC